MEDENVKVKNVSNKVIGINNTVLLPDDETELPDNMGKHPAVRAYLEQGLLADAMSGEKAAAWAADAVNGEVEKYKAMAEKAAAEAEKYKAEAAAANARAAAAPKSAKGGKKAENQPEAGQNA